MGDLKKCVVNRIYGLCAERRITPNALAKKSGVTASTVYCVLESGRPSVHLNTIKALCDGFGITLEEFFASADFS